MQQQRRSGGAPPPLASSRSRVVSSAAPPATAPPEASGPGGQAELERNLRFLQAQHAETLRQLHAEIETLRRQNRDLHYKLIMHPMLQRTEFSPSVSPGKSPPRRLSLEGKGARGSPMSGGREQSQGGFSPVLWADLEPPPVALGSPEGEEEEVAEEEEEAQEGPEKEPPQATPQKKVAAAAERTLIPETQEPSATVEADGRDTEPPVKPSDSGLPKVGYQRHSGATEVCDRATSPILFPSVSHERGRREPNIPPASSNPFLANVLPSNMRKPPTLEECEVVIRQLWNINHMQMQELMYLRSCLEDIHKTHRIPEDYKLAGQLGTQESPHLPRMKNTSKTWILTPLPAAERAVLPALKQTMGNAFAERQKRTQAVQRKRLHRTGL